MYPFVVAKIVVIRVFLLIMPLVKDYFCVERVVGWVWWVGFFQGDMPDGLGVGGGSMDCGVFSPYVYIFFCCVVSGQWLHQALVSSLMRLTMVHSMALLLAIVILC